MNLFKKTPKYINYFYNDDERLDDEYISLFESFKQKKIV